MTAPLGYLSSGRAMADFKKELALRYRASARWCFRVGLRADGRDDMHQAIREWRNYRYYLGKIGR